MTFGKYVKKLAEVLKPLIIFYDRHTVSKTLPRDFSNYPRLRCLIDCSEIFLQKPADLRLQAATWSDYKHHNTLKFLIAVTPQGSVAYVSRLWGGRTSDRHIVRNSNFLRYIDPKDQVLADRGFTVWEELILRGAELVLPPASKGKAQMTSTEVAATKKVANVRIHVERVIQRVKNFHILCNVLPITLAKNANDILTICCGITNLQGPLVQHWIDPAFKF